MLSERSLALSELPPERRKYFETEFTTVGIGAEPNACFVFSGLRGQTPTVAAMPVGFTSWIPERDSVRLTLFRAPDSGYDLKLAFDGDSIHGFGRLWSAVMSNGRPSFREENHVIGVRTGPANPRKCFEAAKANNGS